MCCTCWTAICTSSPRCRMTARTAHTSALGRKAERNNPTECRYCSHWHSCQSVRRPGTFFMWRALVRHGRIPCASRMSYSGIRRVGGGALSCLSAGHRPPLKRGVRFSRATLSRRRLALRCNRRNQLDKLDQLILAIHLALRQLLPTAVAPAFVPMRPNAPLDPMVEFVEERSDVGTLGIVTPSPQDRVQLLDQIFGLQGYTPPGKLAQPIVEARDRFLSGIRIQRP